MLKTSIKPFSCAFLLFLLLAGACAQTPQPSLVDLANDFAQEIVSRDGLPGTVSVSFENLSSLSPADQQAVKNAFLGRLRGSGLRLVKAESAAGEIQITFSEDWQGLVWVANIKQNGGGRLVIKKSPRPQKASALRPLSVTLQKSFVWNQDGPMLDFIQDGKTLLVLEPEQISVYVSDSGKWKLTASLGIVHEFPWPRDLRGRLLGNAHQLTVHLPGLLCTGAASPPQLQCHASDDPWQLENGLAVFFSSARNFFTGVMAGQNAGASVPGFFSAATWQVNDARQWLFTGTDGLAGLYNGNLSSAPAVFRDWGSDAAAVHSNCGTGWQLLVSAPSSPSHQGESIEAMEISNREAVTASSALELSGPVRALWPGASGQTVSGITESLTTGKYEAFVLTVTCNQ